MEPQDVISPEFNSNKISAYLKVIAKKEISLTSIDGQRIYAAFFVLNSLDLLEQIDSTFSQQEKDNIINWIYSLQIVKKTSNNYLIGGFRGNESNGFLTEYQNNVAIETTIPEQDLHQDQPSIVYTQCALESLLILGDDLSRICFQHLIATLKRSKHPLNGLFKSQDLSDDYDIRFLYSALIISKLLKDDSFLDKEQAFQTICQMQNQDNGAFGLQQDLESHGGGTYCAIASLKLLDKIDSLPHKTKLINWLVNRQQLLEENSHNLDECEKVMIEIISQTEYQQQKSQEILNSSHEILNFQDEKTNTNVQSDQEQPEKPKQKFEFVGFNGRINKFPDSCYTTWIGGSLSILGGEELLATKNISRFLKICQGFKGGFKKYPYDEKEEFVHTFFSILGLFILKIKTFSDGDSLDLALLLRKSRINK